MENRNLELWNRGWELTYEFTGWQYSIAGTWEFNDYDEVSEFAFIELDVEVSQKWIIETDDHLQPHILGVSSFRRLAFRNARNNKQRFSTL
jgi:hypothetical protein